MSKKDAIAKTSPNTDLAIPFDYGADAGIGNDITMDDLLLPRVILAQTESKVLIEGEAKFVPGGMPGDLLNVATKEYYPGDKGLLIVPAFKKQSVIEWLPNNAGFVAEHDLGSAVAKSAKANDYKSAAGNDLVPTMTLTAVRLDEETLEPIDFVVLSFSSSKLGAWSNYFTAVNNAKVTKNAPIFSQLVRIVSFDDKNKDGKRYKNYAMFSARDVDGKMIDTSGVTDRASIAKISANAAPVSSLLAPDSAAFLSAKLLFEQIGAGIAKVDYSDSSEEVVDSHF